MTTFVQAYGAAAIIVAGSLLVGAAICSAACDWRAAEHRVQPRRWWAAPLVGLMALIVLAGAAIKLPGRTAPAIVVCALAVLGAAAFLARRRQLRVDSSDVAVAVITLLVMSVPFVASGRIGLQGVSLDNDSAHHLLYAEGLRSARMAAIWIPANGYPLGPHSLFAALGSATGMPLDLALTGLLLAIGPLTALAAAGVLREETPWRRIVVGATCALTYLLAAYYGEGAFKETIVAGALVAFLVHIEQLAPRWGEARASERWLLTVPLLVLATGAFYTYSYVGFAWFAAAPALWLVAEAVRSPPRVRGWVGRRQVRATAPWVVLTAVVGVVIILPVLSQALTFFQSVGVSPSTSGAIPAGNLGNLIKPLSAYESFGIWFSQDFRFDPHDVFHAGELGAFALAVLAFGIVWSLRRRLFLMPAAIAGSFIIWWYSGRHQSPYISAKGLVIVAPVVVAVGLRALLTRGPAARASLTSRALKLLAAAAFCACVLYSSYQELRNEPVNAPEPGRELAAFEHTIGDSTVLFLGDDDFAPWQLHPAAVTSLTGNTLTPGIPTGRNEQYFPIEGQPVDFDSVRSAELDRFQYVVTTNTPYASQPPANFRLVAQQRLYELWQRTGPTVPRQALDPPGTPGFTLVCHSPLGRRLRSSPGVASVMAAPVVGGSLRLSPGRSGDIALPLPPGRWELSIQYISHVTVSFTTQGQRWTMPPYLGRVGPFFALGTVTGQRVSSPVKVHVSAARPSVISGDLLTATVPLIAATRIPDTRTVVPLRQACGRYVDWYRLSS